MAYVIWFNISALVGFGLNFRVSLTAYEIERNQRSDSGPSHQAQGTRRKNALTRRNTLPLVLSSVPWLSRHAAQEVLIQGSRKYTLTLG